MTNHPLVQEAFATGDEIHTIVSNLEPVLYDVPRGHAIISLLSMTIILMNPLITPDELTESVRQTSEFICLIMEGTGQGEEEGVKLMN